MKKLMTLVAMAVGFSALAAQNDPLIPVAVEKGATYDVLCKGEKQFSFTSNKTGSATVQGIAAKSANAGDYQVRLASAPVVQDSGLQGESGEEVEIADCYCLQGPDCYADGSRVLDGEIYALVVTKQDATFAGFVNRGSSLEIVCADQENSVFVQMFGKAQGGKCALEAIDTERLQKNYSGWTIAVYLLDTRKPGMSDLSPRNNGGLPTFVQAYHELGEKTAVSVDGWKNVLLAEDGQTYPFDVSPVLAEGFAVTYANDLWTVRAMPTAWAEEKTDNTVFKTENDMIVLGEKPAGLSFPCSNEVDYVFHVAETPEMCALIAKVVANRPLLAAIMDGATVEQLVPFLGDFTDAEKLLLQNELSAWATKVMPFFSWNADFVVSFDRPVKRGSLLLDGQYDGAAKWNFDTWVGASFKEDLLPGQSIRLLKEAYQEVYLNYSEICTNVIQFQCGAMNFSSNNWGTTMKVALKLYENEGRCQEKGEFTVGTYRYTFMGPLNIVFNPAENQGELVEGDVTMPDALTAEYDGSSSFPLPVPEYDKVSNTNVAFVGWSNRVDNTLWTMVPAGTWADAEHKIQLYAVWQKAQTVQVGVKKKGEETPQQTDIKVTQEWIDANVKKDADKSEVMDRLEEHVDKENTKSLKVWEAYVLGLDASDPNAAVKVEKTEGAEEDKAIVISTVQAPPPDSGFKVAYSLDRVEADETEVKKEGDPQESKDLKIDLEPEDGDTPTGYYKMNVIVTPDGAEKGEKYPAENTIGVLKVESEEKLLPVAVPWLSLEAGTEVMPDEIVDPRTLSENDQIHVWQDSVGGQRNIYTSWHVEDGKWVVNQTAQVNADMSVNMLTAEQARKGSVERGKGVWLERKDTTKPFYLVGQYKQDEKASVQIKAPKDGAKAEYNLIAPTGIEETDLNEVITAGVGGNDKLMIVNKGQPTYYSFDGSTWGYNKQVLTTTASGRVGIRVVRETEAKVPAGIGLWYISEGGEPKINWNK